MGDHGGASEDAACFVDAHGSLCLTECLSMLLWNTCQHCHWLDLQVGTVAEGRRNHLGCKVCWIKFAITEFISRSPLLSLKNCGFYTWR